MAVFSGLLFLLAILSAVGGGDGGDPGSTYSPLPLLFAEGTHYEIGFQIGSVFQSQIVLTMKNNTFFNDRMLPYNQTAEGSRLYSLFLASATKTYPQYVSELHGMADGAEIPFSKVFLWNVMFEWELLLETATCPPASCSDLFLSDGNNNMTLIGHNEDGDPIDIVTSFMVHARIVDPDFGTTDEFLAFCYAGSLCGKAFGVNFIKKTVTSVNALFPQNVNTTFIGRNFLNRATLSLSIEEIRKVLSTVPCSSGFSLNVGSLEELEISNFEVSAVDGFVETKITGYGYHFNMYLHSPDVPQRNDPSSVHRLARVKELPTPTNSADILKILGDTGDKQYPIYRTATPPDGAATLATGLFDLSTGMFYVYRGNPAEVEPEMVIPLPL